MDVTLVKEAGTFSVLGLLDCLGRALYVADFNGASTHFGELSDSIAMHIDDLADDSDAVDALAAAALPTCTNSLLDITVNAGTWIVADLTSIVADGAETKFAKVTIAIDDTTKLLEVVVFEKTTLAYGDLAAGKTHCVDLKEYSVPALGTVLTEINDWIS